MEKDHSDEEKRAGSKKAKPRKRSHEELRRDEEDAMSDDAVEKEQDMKLGPFEHTSPVGPSNYREDENELQIDLEEYKKHGKEAYFEEIQVEFDVRVMEEIDYKALSLGLAPYCHKQTFNNAELADLLLTQKYLGSVIREADDVESYGFISVVPVAHHKDKDCIKQIKRFVLVNCPDSKKSKWKEILDSPKLGLLLNERLINVPNAIAPHLHESVYEEVEQMKQEKLPFNFDTYLCLTTYTHTDDGEDRGEDAEPKQKKARKDAKKEFFKAEDEVYLQFATDKFEFTKSQTETRVAMYFPASKVKQILEAVRSHIEENYNW